MTDLADALRDKGFLAENLLFGDWQQDAELLVPLRLDPHQSFAMAHTALAQMERTKRRRG